jgi:hypothetical protein
MATLLTESVEDGIIQGHPARLAKYSQTRPTAWLRPGSQNGPFLYHFIDYLKCSRLALS